MATFGAGRKRLHLITPVFEAKQGQLVYPEMRKPPQIGGFFMSFSLRNPMLYPLSYGGNGLDLTPGKLH